MLTGINYTHPLGSRPDSITFVLISIIIPASHLPFFIDSKSLQGRQIGEKKKEKEKKNVLLFLTHKRTFLGMLEEIQNSSHEAGCTLSNLSLDSFLLLA